MLLLQAALALFDVDVEVKDKEDKRKLSQAARRWAYYIGWQSTDRQKNSPHGKWIREYYQIIALKGRISGGGEVQVRKRHARTHASLVVFTYSEVVWEG